MLECSEDNESTPRDYGMLIIITVRILCNNGSCVGKLYSPSSKAHFSKK